MRSNRVLLLVPLAFLAVHACGESSNGDDAGGGSSGAAGSGMSGSAGSATGGSATGGAGAAGAGGSGGAGGDDTPGGGEGGENQGGESGTTTGGSAGAAGSGMAGGGTAGSSGSGGSSGGGSGGAAGSGGSGGTGGTTTVSVSQASAGDLVVSEIMRNPAKVDDTLGEWFEVYNASTRAYDLNGLVLADNVGQATVSQSIVIQPGGYVVFARNGGSGNGGVSAHFVYGNALELANAADVVRLSYGSTVIDEVSYDGAGAFPATPGASMSLRTTPPSATTNDVAGNWCAAGTAFGAGDLGTPGAANGGCLKTTTEMAAGDLVITEIMANPAAVADEVGEWFEIKNRTTLAFDLTGLVVRDQGVDTFTVTSTLLVPADGRLVFGANAATATNGGVTVHFAYDRATFAIANTSDEIVLATNVVIDQVAYTTGFPLVAGASMSLSPASETATANDTAGNWCAATTVFGAGDRGTPGAANAACP